jgi:hypothetical protein
VRICAIENEASLGSLKMKVTKPVPDHETVPGDSKGPVPLINMLLLFAEMDIDVWVAAKSADTMLELLGVKVSMGGNNIVLFDWVAVTVHAVMSVAGSELPVAPFVVIVPVRVNPRLGTG